MLTVGSEVCRDRSKVNMSAIVSRAWWEGSLSRRLHAVAGVAALVLVCRLVVEEDVSWLAWLLTGGALLAVSLIRWPYGALAVLIGTSAMPRFFVEAFGWKVRPEHVAVAVIGVAVAAWLLFQKSKIGLEKIDYWMLAYVVLNYVSSALGSPEPSATLRWALQDNLAVLPYFLIRLMVRDYQTLQKAFRIFLAIGAAEAIYGILCYASFSLFGTTTGVEIGQYLGDVAGPYGSMYEANLFGAYTGCCAVVFLALYLSEEQHRLVRLVCFFVASLAMLVSLSRGALLAFVIALWWLIRKARLFRNAPRNKVAPFVVVFVVILVITFTAVGGVLQNRFGALLQEGITEQTTITRVIVYWEALLDVLKHPILGTGTASFNLTFDWAGYVPDWSGDKTWIGNAPLRVLHDTGVLGLTAFLGFFLSVWLKIRRGLHSKNDKSALLLGLSAGAVLYSVSFQSTEGTNLAFCWVYVGLLVSAAIFCERATEPHAVGHGPVTGV
jgi:O-antigen ligase